MNHLRAILVGIHEELVKVISDRYNVWLQAVCTPDDPGIIAIAHVNSRYGINVRTTPSHVSLAVYPPYNRLCRVGGEYQYEYANPEAIEQLVRDIKRCTDEYARDPAHYDKLAMYNYNPCGELPL